MAVITFERTTNQQRQHIQQLSKNERNTVSRHFGFVLVESAHAGPSDMLNYDVINQERRTGCRRSSVTVRPLQNYIRLAPVSGVKVYRLQTT